MKKIIFLLFVTVTLSSSVNSQTDNAKVEKAVLSYIENFFENKFEEMNAVLHPRLSKRGLNLDGTINKDLPPLELKKLMSQKRALPISRQENKVENIIVFKNTATAKLITGYPNVKWAEFIHLVKVDAKWKIIDVFWEFYPREKRKN